jgi:hypothetical protein
VPATQLLALGQETFTHELSTHEPLMHARPAPQPCVAQSCGRHWPSTQVVPPSHATLAHVFAVHVVLLTQIWFGAQSTPGQSLARHLPPAHAWPDAQAWPHEPQLLSSVRVSPQLPPSSGNLLMDCWQPNTSHGSSSQRFTASPLRS